LDRVIRDHIDAALHAWMRDCFSGKRKPCDLDPLPDARWKVMVPANPSRKRSRPKIVSSEGGFNPTGFGVPGAAPAGFCTVLSAGKAMPGELLEA